MSRRRLAVIGNGMAAAALLDELSRMDTGWEVVVLGEERHAAYDRTGLSEVLAGTRPAADLRLRDPAWYRRHGVTLRLGCRVEAVDAARRRLRTTAGDLAFDACVLATGSVPVVPPIPGADLPGVTTFRTLDDVRRLRSLPSGRRAAVVGGGLLGLEAARGLLGRGLEVTVVHLMDRLMERQLDPGAGAFLRCELQRTGMRILLPATTSRIEGSGRVEALALADGTRLPVDLVVVCAGVRPRAELAAAAGLAVDRGVRVDDGLATSAPDIYAVGECAEHRGIVYGLLPPINEQARVLARRLAGDRSATFLGAVGTALLRAAGVDVFAGGRVAAEPGDEEVLLRDDAGGSYRRLVLRGETVVGVALVGDLGPMPAAADALARGAPVADRLALLGVGGDASLPPEAVVCGCGGVTVATVMAAIRGGCAGREAIARRTGAAGACGSCVPVIESLLAGR